MENRPSTTIGDEKLRAKSLSRLQSRNTDYLTLLKEKSEVKRKKSMISVLKQNEKNYTFRKILERSKMIGKTVSFNPSNHSLKCKSQSTTYQVPRCQTNYSIQSNKPSS